MTKKLLICITIFLSIQSMEESIIPLDKKILTAIQHYLDHPWSINPTLELFDAETKTKIAEYANTHNHVPLLIRLDCDKIRKTIHEKKKASEVSLYRTSEEYRDAVAHQLIHYQTSINDFYNNSAHIRRLLRSWGIICSKRMPREFDPIIIRLIALRDSGKAPSKKTVQKIAECSNLEELNLSRFKFSSVPVQFFTFPHLTKLNLNANELSELPEDISSLSNLQELYLSNNLLTHLPESLFQLNGLKVLDLCRNQLTAIPPAINHLENLEYASFGTNHLRSIPAELTELPNLKILSLGANNINVLPETIAQLSNLEKLWLDSNEIEILPATITRLKQLNLLCLCANKLKRIPTTISELTNLKHLDLKNNKLTEIPDNITNLSRLKVLLLSNNLIPKSTIKSYESLLAKIDCLSL